MAGWWHANTNGRTFDAVNIGSSHKVLNHLLLSVRCFFSSNSKKRFSSNTKVEQHPLRSSSVAVSSHVSWSVIIITSSGLFPNSLLSLSLFPAPLILNLLAILDSDKQGSKYLASLLFPHPSIPLHCFFLAAADFLVLVWFELLSLFTYDTHFLACLWLQLSLSLPSSADGDELTQRSFKIAESAAKEEKILGQVNARVQTCTESHKAP